MRWVKASILNTLASLLYEVSQGFAYVAYPPSKEVLMKIVRLYTGKDSHSYFGDIDAEVTSEHPLGNYSKEFPVKTLLLRHSKWSRHKIYKFKKH